MKPVGDIIENRNTKIKLETEKVERMTQDIEETTSQIELALKNAKKESVQIREVLIQEGEDTRDELIAKNRNTSRAMFEEKMLDLEKRISKAEKELEKQIDFFKEKIKEIFL